MSQVYARARCVSRFRGSCSPGVVVSFIYWTAERLSPREAPFQRVPGAERRERAVEGGLRQTKHGGALDGLAETLVAAHVGSVATTRRRDHFRMRERPIPQVIIDSRLNPARASHVPCVRGVQ